MLRIKILFLSLVSLFIISHAHAAIPSKKIQTQKILTGDSFITGGVAGLGFSVLNVHSTKLADNAGERIIIDLGDYQGRPLKGLPAYYHARIQQNPPRLVVDFAQTTMSQLDAKALQSRFNKSGLIKKTSMFVDPVEGSMSVVFELKSKVKAKIFQVPGQKGTSRVVADLIL